MIVGVHCFCIFRCEKRTCDRQTNQPINQPTNLSAKQQTDGRTNSLKESRFVSENGSHCIRWDAASSCLSPWIAEFERRAFSGDWYSARSPKQTKKISKKGCFEVSEKTSDTGLSFYVQLSSMQCGIAEIKLKVIRQLRWITGYWWIAFIQLFYSEKQKKGEKYPKLG